MSDQSQELTTYDPKLLAKARKLSGMGSSFPRVSYIKVNYQEPKGHFILKEWNSDVDVYDEIDLGDSFKGMILVCTKKCSQWDNELNSNLYESREFYAHDEIIQLISGNKIEDEGTYSELKEHYPNLKFSLVLYVLLESRKQPVKFFVKGKSLKEFWNYESLLAKSKGVLQGVETLFSLRPEKKGGVEYFVIEFDEAARFDIPKLSANMLLSEEVHKGIALFNENFQKRVSE